MRASAPDMQATQGQREILVIAPLNDWSCSECAGSGDLLRMEDPGPICMSCAELDHLLFLPSGDAALTRRAKKHSELWAVVVRFSRSRRRYERQGLLVESAALDRAEQECLADAEARERRRARDEIRRSAQDRALQGQMAREIRRRFPGCPAERAEAIARHSATRGSGRVGRSAAGRALESHAIELAVAASVRHVDTSYDDLLMAGVDRHEARERVGADAERVLAGWRSAGEDSPAERDAGET